MRSHNNVACGKAIEAVWALCKMLPLKEPSAVCSIALTPQS